MPPSQQVKKLSVRLPELELRRIKSLAALRGVTLEQAVLQALEAWASQPQKEGALPLAAPGPLAEVAAERPGGQTRAAKPTPARRRAADAEPAPRPDGGQPPDLDGAALAWLQKAGTLDWSKCSAVESVPTKIGSVWTVRGTRVPVAAIFGRLAKGQELDEIAGVLGLTHEQMKAVLQFAVEGGMFPSGAAKT